MKKIMIASALSCVIFTGSVNATDFSFSNTINFTTTNDWDFLSYVKGTDGYLYKLNNFNFSQTVSLSDFDKSVIDLSDLTIDNVFFEIKYICLDDSDGSNWISYADGAYSNLISNIPFVSHQWNTMQVQLTQSVIDLISQGTPWNLTVFFKETTAHGDVILVDYARLYGTAHDSNVDSSPVPEPASILLFGSGVLGFAGLSRRKNKITE